MGVLFHTRMRGAATRAALPCGQEKERRQAQSEEKHPMPLFAACCLASTPPSPTHCLLFTGWGGRKRSAVAAAASSVPACQASGRGGRTLPACIHQYKTTTSKLCTTTTRGEHCCCWHCGKEKRRRRRGTKEGRKEGGREDADRPSKPGRRTSRPASSPSRLWLAACMACLCKMRGGECRTPTNRTQCCNSGQPEEEEKNVRSCGTADDGSKPLAIANSR
jgi:hypothetical protein